MQKILIVHTGGGLGDVLLSTPVIEALKFNYPEAKIDFLARSSTAAAIKNNPFIHSVYTINKARLSWSEVFSWSRRIAGQKYDAALILWSNTTLALMLYLANIPIRVGQDSRFSYSWTYTHKVRIRSEHGDDQSHWSDIMLDFVRALRLPVPPFKPRFVISDQAVGQAQQLMQALPQNSGPVIGLHPSKGISNVDKRWPTSVFANWLNALYHQLQARLVVTGGPQELEITKRIIEEAKVPCLNLAGKTDTEVLAAVARQCQVFICPDSGPAHLAAISGVPTLDICALKEDFPNRWKPVGAPVKIIRPASWNCRRLCRKNECPDFNCYKQIDGQQIVEGVKQLLQSVENKQ